MKTKICSSIVIFFIIFVSTSFVTDNKDERKNKVLIQVLTSVLQNAHYLNLKIDDGFSKKVYNAYIEKLDYGKRFFTQEDIEKLKKYELLVDDEISKGSFELYTLANEILDQRTKQIEDYYNEILTVPFNFDIDETIQINSEKSNWAKNDEELKDYWRKSLKYSVMVRIIDQLQIQEDAIARKDTSVKQKSFETIESESRAKVLETYKDWSRRSKQIKENEKFSLFLNSIADTYDPHTTYMVPNDKEAFDISMSGTFEGIGATLQENNGYIKVVNIIPGSASWRQGELKVNDVILKVGQADKEPVSIIDMRIDDAVKLIRGPKGTEVRLTVKKSDNTTKVISIIRDQVIVEETFAKSCVIQDPATNTRIGYIYLPKFYSNFENKDGRHCFNDVKKEIEKIKKENVEGIVFDLRDNGGGSLYDVVDLTGLFIAQGPIVQVKTRVGSPDLLKDNDANVAYSGPLVVMVNSLSASASEIMAAAIQDYNRGIIIGSPSTFGKGTVQRIVDFDPMLNNSFADVKPLGALSITIQKFYRINGGATQLKGVTPDIILPDNYSHIKVGERELDNAMPWDEISPAKYDKWKPKYNISKLLNESKNRIAKDTNFVLINENALRFKNEQDNSVVSLNISKYRQDQKNKKELAKRFDKVGKADTGVSVFTLNDDVQKINADTVRKASNTDWHKNLKKDIYLKEAIWTISKMK